MKHSYSITTAIALAIAIPLVLGTAGIIDPSIAYANDPKNIDLNLAYASNTATQTNDCGNYSIVQDNSDVNCGNLAAQSNEADQTQTNGGDPKQINLGFASNTATQTNDCGNYSIVQDNSDVNCGNLAAQSNEADQTQTTDDPNGNGDGGTNTQLNIAHLSNSADQSNYCGNYSIVQDDSDVNCGNAAYQ